MGRALAEPEGFCAEYDCVAEWIMPDEAAFAECLRVMNEPVAAKAFRDDEALFLDSQATRLVRCDTRDTGTM